MKKFLSATILGIALLPVCAQEYLWHDHIGGYGYSLSYQCAVDHEGSVYISGYFDDTIASVNQGAGEKLSYQGGYDIFLFKYLVTGELDWSVSIGGTGIEYTNDIAVDDSGNVYVTGCYDNSCDFGQVGLPDVPLASGTGYAIFVAKYNTHGKVMWINPIAPPASASYKPRIYGIDVVRDNIFISGMFQSSLDFDPGPSDSVLTPVSVGKDIFLARYDTSGRFIWVNHMGGADNGYGREIDVDDSLNVYMTGHFHGTVDFDPGPGLFELTSKGSDWDAFIAKYDSTGKMIFAKNACEGSGESNGRNIIVDTSGKIFLSGLFFGSADFDPEGELLRSSAGEEDIFLSCFDHQGRLLWNNTFGSSGRDWDHEMIIDCSNNLRFVGVYENTVDFDPTPAEWTITSKESLDGYYAVYNLNGELIDLKGFESIGKGSVSMIESFNGRYYFVGNFDGSFDVDPGEDNAIYVESFGQHDIFIMCAEDSLYRIFQTSTLCEGDSVFFKGKYWSGEQQIIDTLVASNDFDSLVYLDIIELPVFVTEISSGLCDGDSLLLNGRYVKSGGVYHDTLSTYLGCDSVVITEIEVFEHYQVSSEAVICGDDSLIVADRYLKQSGTYYDTLESVNGCDSILITDLIVNEVYSSQFEAGICESDSLFVVDRFVFNAGTYRDTLETISGCDSLITTIVSVWPEYSESENYTICEGDSILIGDKYYSNSGTYTDSLETQFGCDSVISNVVEVTPKPDKPEITLIGTDTLYCSVQGDKYFWIFNDEVLSDSLRILVPEQSGSYHVVVISGECLSDASTAFEFIVKGIRDISSSENFIIYPNPAYDRIYIESRDNNFEETSVSLLDVSGRKVIERKFRNSLEIKVSYLQKGLYLILINQKGNIQSDVILVE